MKTTSCLLMMMLFGTAQLQAKKIEASLSHAAFQTPSGNPYVETYLSISGLSVHFKKIDPENYQGSVAVLLTCLDGDKIIYADKYNLLSPSVKDTLAIDFRFIDQKRISIPEGKYTLEISLTDNSDTSNHQTIQKDISLLFPKDQVSFSDIELIDSYSPSVKEDILTKNGFSLVPKTENFFHVANSKLIYYSEIYNSSRVSNLDAFVLCSYIEKSDNGYILNSFSKLKKYESKEVIPVLNEFNIQELPSGNYNLVLQIKDRTGMVLVEKKSFFQRSNPSHSNNINDIGAINTENSFVSGFSTEEVIDHIRSLAPISTRDEQLYVSNLLKVKDPERMKQYFIYFWQKRNLAQPAQAWEDYYSNVKMVNANYSSNVRKGYDTDRGRVYLRYGAPNSINSHNMDNTAYPYEIWHYYHIENYSNKRFVFYNPEIVSNDFKLLHSDFPGEPFDARWKFVLLSRNSYFNNTNLDTTNPDSYMGDRIQRDYDN